MIEVKALRGVKQKLIFHLNKLLCPVILTVSALQDVGDFIHSANIDYE